MSRSVTVTDGVLTEEDVLRRSRAANLGSVKHLTIYGAGSEHKPPPALSLSPTDSLCTPPCACRAWQCATYLSCPG